MSYGILAELRRDNPDLDVTYNNDIFNKALIMLEDKTLAITNQTLKQLGVQSPVRNEQDAINQELLKELSYNVRELQRYIDENELLLIEDQRRAYNVIMNHIAKELGAVIFWMHLGALGKHFS